MTPLLRSLKTEIRRLAEETPEESGGLVQMAMDNVGGGFKKWMRENPDAPVNDAPSGTDSWTNWIKDGDEALLTWEECIHLADAEVPKGSTYTVCGRNMKDTINFRACSLPAAKKKATDLIDGPTLLLSVGRHLVAVKINGSWKTPA